MAAAQIERAIGENQPSCRKVLCFSLVRKGLGSKRTSGDYGKAIVSLPRFAAALTSGDLPKLKEASAQAEEAEFAAAAMKPPSPQSLDPILCPSLQMLEWSFFGFVSGAWPLWGGGSKCPKSGTTN